MKDFVGKRCRKTRGRGRNPKPFKSGLQINTIKGLTTNPFTGKDAFTFEEDDSIVNCDKIELVE